jgi:uncharacterized cupredoxin-like copper-binding protein
MKRTALLFVIAIIMILAAACGGSSTPAATQAPTAAAQPAATNPSAAQPSLTQAASASSAATEVDVTLADNTIQSSLTTFKVGVPYSFVIKNTGRHAHTFDISTPVAAAGSLDAAQSTALLDVTKDQLPGGANLTVNYTFPASAAGAQLEFSCLIQMHYEDGMRLAITVTQ